jgi:putative hydrolase of the HAD superfamily
MPLTDRKVLTFDVVGTLINFETGILEYVQGKSKTASAQAILEAYATAEDRQHHEPHTCPSLR